MNNFYALATTSQGKNYIITFDHMEGNAPQLRYQAEQAAQDICKQNGLVYQGTYQIDGSQKQDKTLTKFKKYRLRSNGKNPRNYASAL